MADPDLVGFDWLQDVENALADALIADETVSGIAKKIENGLMEPIAEQMITGLDVPFIGVIASGFSGDRDETIGEITSEVVFTLQLVAVHARQKIAQADIRKLLSALHVFALRQRTGSLLSYGTANVVITDLHPGDGSFSDVMAMAEGYYQVNGQYQMEAEIRLTLP